MAKNTVYGYFIGSNFSDISERAVERVEEFIRSRTWICRRVWSVDQPRIASDGQPEWDLGFNVDLPDPYEEPSGWFSDIEALLEFALQLRREFGHDIVIGISDNRTVCAEDIIEIDSEQPDVDYLRRFIGIQPPVA